MLHEPDQPVVTDRVEERTDISVQDPPDIASLDAIPGRVQRIMLASPRTEPVAEAQELGLVNWRQDGDHGGLDDFVLQGGDAERPLPAMRLRDEPSPRGQRSIRSSVDPFVEVREVALEVLRIVGPCQPSIPGAASFLKLRSAHRRASTLM
jgi:hypothetical protein